MTPAEEMTRLGARAKEAARAIAKAHPDAKSQALLGLAELLQERQAEILAANAQDLAAARAAGQDEPRLDRLTLTPAIMDEMRAACRYVANLPDPVGATERQWQRPNGILVGRMRVPLGRMNPALTALRSRPPLWMKCVPPVGTWPTCPIPWAPQSASGSAPTAFLWAACACRWA